MTDDPDESGQNPFKGTPFEQFFGGGGGMPDLQRAVQPDAGA